MIYEPMLDLSDPLGTMWVPNFDTAPEQCPSCQGQIEGWMVESAKAELGLCVCAFCGVMVAA